MPDLVWDTLSDADRTAICEKILRPALKDVILPHQLGIHNIQCRHNAAIGLVGFLLDDRELIKKAIDDPKEGFRQQIAKGVDDDGMCAKVRAAITTSPSTACCRWRRRRALRDRSLFAAVQEHVRWADESGDAGFALAEFQRQRFCAAEFPRGRLQLAYARWKDEKYLPLISSSDRRSRTALFYGVDELPRSLSAASICNRAGPSSARNQQS